MVDVVRPYHTIEHTFV